MNVSDIVFWAWYQILSKTLYVNRIHDDGIGPKEHSFFITFLSHAINLWTILRLLLGRYLHVHMSLSASLVVFALSFVIGYISYMRGGRWNRIVTYNVSRIKALIFVFIAISYTVTSAWFMLKTGDYLREQFMMLK
jgi:hypothetical protein